MNASLKIAHLAVISSFFAFLIPFSHLSSSHLLPIGARPLDEKLYISEVIRCKDGSNSFTKDRINDDYCDCLDGTDEPGTSACPSGEFYCRNVGSMPQFLFSSHVNDGICDCCDGSDEYHGVTVCPNSCVMGGNSAFQSVNYIETYKRQSSVESERSKLGLNTKGAFDKLRVTTKSAKYGNKAGTIFSPEDDHIINGEHEKQQPPESIMELIHT